MERLRPSNSSKVAVEYHDPSGIFPLVSNALQQRLPLRNLHWNSSARPLRSISSLHVELVAADKHRSPDTWSYGAPDPVAKTAANSTSSTLENASPKTSRVSQGAETIKERRHQIPGLRQTPYLKIYLLRCDDTEAYKGVSRKLLREWVKEHTPPSQSSTSPNKGENHDAFEWLIVHVLPPTGDTVNGAHVSGSFRGENNIDRGSGSTRWSTRGSSTVVEKIRADFNGTSKTAIDRVAQIQLHESSDVTSVTHSSPSISDPQTRDEKGGWNDLIFKLKFLILASFDLRVSQYEDDIKEKESQRNIPGWNFNTFFVLKEGLARGFESVGLIEDALTGYRELAAALNTIVDEQSAKNSAERQTAVFRTFTNDLWEEIQIASNSLQADLHGQSNRGSDVGLENGKRKGLFHDLGALVLDTDRKPYRELILANSISAFDFLCYVFARQVSLLLRLANEVALDGSFLATGDKEPRNSNTHLKSNGPEQDSNEEEAKNLLILSDIGRQAVEFMACIARTIRNDLRSSIQDPEHGQEKVFGLSKTIQNSIVENLVTSWIFSATQCILEKTATPSLYSRLKPLLNHFSLDEGVHGKSGAKATGTVKRAEHPDRTSSLPSPIPLVIDPSPQAKLSSALALDAVWLQPPISSQTGFQELAIQQAELTGLARRALESLGLRCGFWKGPWGDNDYSHSSEYAMDDVSLDTPVIDAPPSRVESFSPSQPFCAAGLRNQVLHSSVKGKNAFYATYEKLSVSTLGLFVLGDRHKSARAVIADIAAMRFLNGDYSAAALYFDQLAPYYAKADWGHLEKSMLNMYAQCLERTNRYEDYIQVGLKVIARLVRQNWGNFGIQPSDKSRLLTLSNLISASNSLDKPVSAMLDDYFDNIMIDPHPRHFDDHDGFQLRLTLRNCTSEAVKAQKIQVKITSIDEEHHSEFWLAADGIHILEPGTFTVLLGTKAMIPAWYVPNKIALTMQNIEFTKNLSPPHREGLSIGSGDPISLGSVDNINRVRILVWPSPRALEARLSLYNRIHLEQPRSVELQISSGWNSILSGKLLLRSGSAGLRLRTADALLMSTNTNIVDQSQPGIIGFGELSADTTMGLRVPYDLESDLSEITVKMEILYTTAKGDFTYAYNPRISTPLPLGVNVQDIFQQSALFSRFTISTANSIPLRVSKCYVQDTLDFEASGPLLPDSKIDIFPRQPLSIVSRIHRKKRATNFESKDVLQTRLALEIEYRSLDQEISETLEQCCSRSLATANLSAFTRLLVPAFLAKTRSKLSIPELETIGLRREIVLDPMLHKEWNMILAGVRPEHHHELSEWLTNWQEKHATIPIPEDFEPKKSHYLTVPVDIPQMAVVHTAWLKLHHNRQRALPEPEVAAVSQTIPAELVIKHTRRWLSQGEMRPKSQALSFCYEVQANPDTWLIGGQRKSHFSAKEDEVLSFSLLLIPQRTGYLLYPSLDILVSQLHDPPHSGKTRKSLDSLHHSCETDYRSQGETLLVVPNLSSSTVSLEPGNSVAGAWLVDSRARWRI